MSDRDLHWERLARFLAGESPPEEAAAIREWLAADTDRVRLLDGLRGALARVRFLSPPDLDVEAALARVHDRMDAPVVRSLRTAPGGRQPLWQRPLARIAATVVLIAGAGVLFLLRREEAPPAGTVAATWRTGIGQTDTLRLPDGSTVAIGTTR